MERTADRIVIFGLVAVLIFGGLVGLWVAASPSSVVSTGAPHAGPAVTTLEPAPLSAARVGTYLVTFTETELPSGTLWFVNITGQSSLATTSSSISTLLANGSYSYTVAAADPSYGASSSFFAVSGAPVALEIGFTAVASHGAYAGVSVGTLSSGDIVVIVAGVAVVAVVSLTGVRLVRSARPTRTHRPPAA
jgi:hypothetical protein